MNYSPDLSTLAPNPGPLIVASLTIQPDGKPLLFGAFNPFTGTAQFVVARLNQDGSVDSSFGLDPALGLDSWVSSVSIQPDGKILLAGFGITNTVGLTGIARLNSKGSLDNSFQPGAGTNRITGSVRSVVLLPAQKLLVTGYFQLGSTTASLVILNADGSLDPSFVANTAAFPGGPVSLLVPPDGGTIMFGYSGRTNALSSSGLARLNRDGSWDTSFDWALPLGHWVQTMVLEPDGETIIAAEGSTPYSLVQMYAVGVPRLAIAAPPITGSLQLSLAADIGHHYRIDFSANLLDWSPLTTLWTTNSPQSLAAPLGAGDPHRFYRAVFVP